MRRGFLSLLKPSAVEEYALQYDDTNSAWNALASDPDEQRWQELMSTLADVFPDGRREHDLQCVFEFEPLDRSTSV